MKRILHWIKGAWLWVFSDVRTGMRKRATPHDDAGKGDEDG